MKEKRLRPCFQTAGTDRTTETFSSAISERDTLQAQQTWKGTKQTASKQLREIVSRQNGHHTARIQPNVSVMELKEVPVDKI